MFQEFITPLTFVGSMILFGYTVGHVSGWWHRKITVEEQLEVNMG
jgi:hypothetical protein